MTAAENIMGMVLAAGMGTRLRPRTENMPKALVPVAGRPMIHYPLLWLRSRGVREIIINTHYLGHMLEEELGDGSGLGVSITWSREEELLGTGGGVGRARRFFKSSRLVLINADTIIEADLDDMINTHQRSGAAATMAMVEAGEPDAYTQVLVDNKGLVRAIGGKPAPSGKQGRGDSSPFGLYKTFHFAGLSVLDPGIIDYLPDDRFASLVSAAMVPAIADGKKIAAWQYRGYWKALDDMERIKETEADLREGRLSLPG
jgi:NDP-sugar pyrophosphorylase family protein